MSSIVPSVEGQTIPSVQEQTIPSEITPTELQTNMTEAAIGTTRASIASVADLRTVSPQLYKAIMMGIAMNVRSQQEASNRRIKEILDEAKRDQR